MKRLFPAPLLSVLLCLVWLLLNRSASPGQIILGVLLGWLIPMLTQGLRPRSVSIKKPGTILRLGLRVAADSVQSNAAVLRLLLMPGSRKKPAGFVHVPLQLRDPNGLAVLAMIVCITPGTAWAEISRDRSILLLHVLEADDPQGVIDHIKAFYERPLMEIFE
ncbi:Na+/H+ antiporter subunit E [Comamonas piscis]|uniref:Na+/H+ antiporter subunit E n=1 Tax=Comamonas piscis TaxID=1562974 RepID=A0A7G5EI20_9BURK|nr:Na+/H+ antiporter subunit E [Comamonas piscis]QMV73645.1 Na+/H+ antiporter subunit E [Comamonas piscis]WSO32068.1 Na+/H+ antiporter subunit E [Comamonas piscis]